MHKGRAVPMSHRHVGTAGNYVYLSQVLVTILLTKANHQTSCWVSGYFLRRWLPYTAVICHHGRTQSKSRTCGA